MFINSDFHITVLRVASVTRLRNSPVGVTVRNHSRSRWALVLKQHGRTYYTAEGRQILSDGQHPVLLPKGCAYSWKCTEPGDCLMIEFEAAEQNVGVVSFFCVDSSFFVNIFDKLRRLVSKTTPDGRMEAMSHIYSLLHHLIKANMKEYYPKRKQQLLAPAMEYISAHYDQPGITNTQLAALCGISTVYFRKCFEGVYGVPPIRYLHDLRIRIAKDILSGDYGSVSDVADSVGYSSVYHFSKMFRLYTGLSPSQYAKK